MLQENGVAALKTIGYENKKKDSITNFPTFSVSLLSKVTIKKKNCKNDNYAQKSQIFVWKIVVLKSRSQLFKKPLQRLLCKTIN